MIPTLIDNAREWHKFWSLRVGAAWGLVIAYLAANPDQTQDLLSLLPEGPWRILASAAIGLLAYSTLHVARVAKQPQRESRNVRR